MWYKMHGITSDYLLCIFGLKDGLAFYFMRDDDPYDYTYNVVVGTPGCYLSVPDRAAHQRAALHSHGPAARHQRVPWQEGRLCGVRGARRSENTNILVGDAAVAKAAAVKLPTSISTSLLVDATGRFRQQISKKARIKRFDGFNTDAFWAYYDCP